MNNEWDDDRIDKMVNRIIDQKFDLAMRQILESTISRRPKRTLAERLSHKINSMLEIIHAIGEGLFGSIWTMLFESVQDAVALSLLIQVPDLISILVLGESFSEIDTCFDYDAWNISRYVCSTVVVSDYTLWALMIPRFVLRFIRECFCLVERKKN